MISLELTRQEQQLLSAALNPDATVAVEAWEKWAGEVRLEEAPYSELRMLSPVYEHLNRIAPSVKLPNKLRGKARSTFTKNRLLAHEALPILREMSRHTQVLLTKGIAMCVRFDAWSSREMGDIDIQVPQAAFAKVCEILSQSGWIPHYGMTWASLEHRSSLRRNSWNLAKGHAQLDLHWRAADGPSEDWFTCKMWESAEPAELLGHPLLLLSSEFSFFTSLNHGFNFGTRADAVQTVIDATSLLPVCRPDRLIPLLKKANLSEPLRQVAEMLKSAGLAKLISRIADDYREVLDTTSAVACKAQVKGEASSSTNGETDVKQAVDPSLTSAKREKALLRHPALYRLWEMLGRDPRIERLLMRLSGPLSRPLAWSGAFKEDYDLRDCAVMDQVAGPGWGWPEPGRVCFWSDRADARLLIPLRHMGDQLIVLGLAECRLYSPNRRINVFMNGFHSGVIDVKERLEMSEYCFLVPRRLLFRPHVEISFRPQPYEGERGMPPSSYWLMRSIPVRRLRVIDIPHLNTVFNEEFSPLRVEMLNAKPNPQGSKLERIKWKIETSPFRNDTRLPSGFDPAVYVLFHPDLIEHEVDPCHHFIHHGQAEGRSW
jgi:hypothetical protein